MKKWHFLLSLVILGGLGWQFRWPIRDFIFELRRPELPPPVAYKAAEVRQPPLPLLPQAGGENREISPPPMGGGARGGGAPSEVNLAIPFTSQAPHAVWDYVHEETCEEASALMVDAYFDGRALGGPNQVEEELQKLVSWQKVRFGYFEDTTAQEVGTLLKEYYGYKRVEVVYDISIDDIKNRLREGLPVIVPAHGRILGNPFYTPPGPDYHMLVVRGVTKEGKFVTNDPGTRRGEAYVYHPQVLWQAIHDWNGGDVEGGRKVMIVVYPPEFPNHPNFTE